LVKLNQNQIISLILEIPEYEPESTKDYFIKIWDINTGEIIHNILPYLGNEDSSYDFLIRINDFQFANLSLIPEGLWDAEKRKSENQNKINIFDVKNNKFNKRTIIYKIIQKLKV